MSDSGGALPGEGVGQPVFEVKARVTDVRCEVRVNDVPVLRLPGGHVVTEFDVNPHVFTGENTLSLTVRPKRRGEDFGENAACTVSFQRRASKDATEAETLATLIFSGPAADVSSGFERSPGFATTAPPAVERTGIRATQRFDLVTPFKPWSWMTAPPIRVNESVRTELLNEYRRVWQLMRRRDIDALVRECMNQARDWQEAYYLASEEEAVRLLGVPQTFADQSVEIDDFPDTDLKVELLGGGRLIQLVDDQGESPLVLRVKDVSNMTGRFVCIFCRTAGGFRIAR